MLYTVCSSSNLFPPLPLGEQWHCPVNFPGAGDPSLLPLLEENQDPWISQGHKQPLLLAHSFPQEFRSIFFNWVILLLPYKYWQGPDTVPGTRKPIAYRCCAPSIVNFFITKISVSISQQVETIAFAKNKNKKRQKHPVSDLDVFA